MMEELLPAVSNAEALFAPCFALVTIGGKRKRKCKFEKAEGHTCGKEVKNHKAVFENHWRTHTGEKPFKCTEEGCDEAFARSDTLDVHVRTHTGEKPFKCTECGKAFTALGTRDVHMRTHTGEKKYQCTEEGCDETFARSDNLDVHVRTHTGEKKFKCTFGECDKAFATSGALIYHVRTHTGEKPYKCTECGMAFAQSSSLDVHVRGTHKGEKQRPCKGDKTSGTCGLGLSGMPKYDKHCVHCFCYNWPNDIRATNAKKYLHAKELAVRAFLEVTFSEYRWSFDRRHAVGVFVRPDAKALLGKHRLLIVEVDEESHNTYACALEREREAIIAKHAPPGAILHLIRFNPDAYDDPVTGKRVPSCFRYNKESGTTIVDPKHKADWDARLAMLKGVINEIVAHQHEDIAVPMCLLAEDRYKHVIPIELFYDNVLEKWPNGNVQKLAALKRNATLRKASQA